MMHKYLTIKELIAIQEYQKLRYSIRKTAEKIKFSKSTVHRIYNLLNNGLAPLQISVQSDENKYKAGRKLIQLSNFQIKL